MKREFLTSAAKAKRRVVTHFNYERSGEGETKDVGDCDMQPFDQTDGGPHGPPSVQSSAHASMFVMALDAMRQLVDHVTMRVIPHHAVKMIENAAHATSHRCSTYVLASPDVPKLSTLKPRGCFPQTIHGAKFCLDDVCERCVQGIRISVFWTFSCVQDSHYPVRSDERYGWFAVGT